GEMPAALHDVPSRRPDVRDRVAASSEYPVVEQVVARWCVVECCRVESDEIGPSAGCDRAAVAPERLRAAGQRQVEQLAATGFVGLCEHDASLVTQPLRVFELPQLLVKTDADVGVGADA